TVINRYNGDTFNCLNDDSKVIPIGLVNDDYCDCPDGSDEPGTAACSNGQLYCPNKGHKPQIVSSMLVNDGVCDCCDGTDEYLKKIQCPNTCREQGAEMRRAREDRLYTYTKGLKIKARMIDEAKSILRTKQQQLDTLKSELDPLDQLIAKYQRQRERLINKQKQEQRKQEEQAMAENENVEEQQEAQHQQQEQQHGEVVQQEIEKIGLDVDVEEHSLPSTTLSDIDDALDTARKELTEKKEQIESIENMLKLDFGKDSVFLPLHGKCFESKTKDYTYTVCPYDKATQGATNLGKWEGWRSNYTTMSFQDGLQCWGGPKRSLLVQVECGVDNEAWDIQEPSKCEYTIRFKSPAACDDIQYEQLQQEQKKLEQ
ncbi:hypothetical protein SAMD00019534_001880, partial [Acytostelium subglobosum LB1]|uniref:hypothetical protein n=1 Tax=Acytostelium subglobosum LB1 TaxID=1410327 RepID=UPI000644EFBC